MCHHELESFQILEDFSHNNCGDINKCDFFFLHYNELDQNLADLRNSVNQYFPEQWLKNQTWTKDPFKVQDRWKRVREMASESTANL